MIVGIASSAATAGFRAMAPELCAMASGEAEGVLQSRVFTGLGLNRNRVLNTVKKAYDDYGDVGRGQSFGEMAQNGIKAVFNPVASPQKATPWVAAPTPQKLKASPKLGKRSGKKASKQFENRPTYIPRTLQFNPSQAEVVSRAIGLLPSGTKLFKPEHSTAVIPAQACKALGKRLPR